ncbi:MAG: transglycosylase SLT domain-containing protein, partial [Chloroflexi bacterium]|nr:transglycosylase SLT domain-containing protein [Chloroflexota bacterium]
GKRAEAYQAYQELISDFAEAFEGMRRLAPDALTLAQDLIAATYYSDALEVLRDPALRDDPRYKAVRAQALFSLGRYDEAQEAYQNWLATSPEDTTARMGLARSLGRLGRLEEALEIYRDLDTAESRLAQAEILESRGEIEEALALYRDLPYPVAWWRAASILEREGRAQEALPFYARLGSAPIGLSDDAAYRLYVLARRLDDREMQSQAVSLLQDATSSFFPLLLGDGSFLAPVASAPARAGDAILAKVRALEILGLDELARRELRMAARFNYSAGIDLSMAQALAQRGRVQDAQQIAEQSLRELDPAPLAFWRLAYPKAYRREVEEAAQEFGLDPLLVWAVMRQESRYNPEAVSRSYAQGLMQLIPSTRDMIARQLGMRLRPFDVFNPRINVRLGAYYLRFVLDQFEGDVDYAVAAYNGGPGNVARWLEDPLVVTKEDFYRWMDLSETREFVQKVMFNYRVYQWLEVMQAS